MHLWAGGAANPPPLEYVELQLCREFHVMPSQLRQERLDDLDRWLVMMDVEAKVRKQRNNGKHARNRYQRRR